MTVAAIRPITIEEFLQLPETEPAPEFINRKIIQKPMPQGEHSQLQGLSPDQKYNQVLAKLLHCAESGIELGWLLDADKEKNAIAVDRKMTKINRKF